MGNGLAELLGGDDLGAYDGFVVVIGLAVGKVVGETLGKVVVGEAVGNIVGDGGKRLTEPTVGESVGITDTFTC